MKIKLLKIFAYAILLMITVVSAKPAPNEEGSEGESGPEHSAPDTEPVEEGESAPAETESPPVEGGESEGAPEHEEHPAEEGSETATEHAEGEKAEHHGKSVIKWGPEAKPITKEVIEKEHLSLPHSQVERDEDYGEGEGGKDYENGKVESGEGGGGGGGDGGGGGGGGGDDKDKDKDGKDEDLLKALLGLINPIGMGFKTLYDMLKTTKDIIHLLGFDLKEDIILFDRVCGKCQLWIKCYSLHKWLDWVEIDEEEGAVLKFTTRIPHDWNLLFLGNWRCRFKDSANGREVEAAIFGGNAPKYSLNLIRIKADKIVAIDPETKRIDVGFKNVYW